MQKVIMGGHGRVVIPAVYRKQLDVSPGDELVMSICDGELRVSTVKQSILKARQLVKRYVAKGDSLVDELFAIRKEESGSEK